jgi:DNA polymerase-1
LDTSEFEIGLLQWRGLTVNGPVFDTMIAHSLIEPDMRHSLDYLSEVYLAYSPSQRQILAVIKGRSDQLEEVPLPQIAQYATGLADLCGQLRSALEPLLKRKGQERVFYEIEAPLVAVLAGMEVEGIRVDGPTLAEIGNQLWRNRSTDLSGQSAVWRDRSSI